MEIIITICYILAFVGAINWGLVGIFNFDLFCAIAGTKFGEFTRFSRLIYILVLSAGIIAAIHYFTP